MNKSSTKVKVLLIVLLVVIIAVVIYFLTNDEVDAEDLGQQDSVTTDILDLNYGGYAQDLAQQDTTTSIDDIYVEGKPVDVVQQETVTTYLHNSYDPYYDVNEITFSNVEVESSGKRNYTVFLTAHINYDHPNYVDHEGEKIDDSYNFKAELTDTSDGINIDEIKLYMEDKFSDTDNEISYVLVDRPIFEALDYAPQIFIDTMKTGDFSGKFYTDAHGGMSPEPVDGMSLEEAEELGLVEEAANTKHDNTSLFMSQRQFMIDLFGEDVWDRITLKFIEYDNNYSTYRYQIYVDGSASAPTGETKFTFEITDRLGYWSLYDSIQWRTPINPEDMRDI